MSRRSLYEKVLAGQSGAARSPARAPRDSASVVLWRRQADAELELFWIRRAPGMAFMGGWYAFPGGGVASRDSNFRLASGPVVASNAPEGAGMPAALTEGVALGPLMAPGVAVAAVRELFEETGVLPGLTVADAPAERVLELRRTLAAKELLLAEVLAELALDLDVSRLVYAGRWLTPQLGPVRFDNRFFLLEWPDHEAIQPEVDGEECVFGEWIRPGLALERWQRGELMAAPPILHLMRVLAEDGPERGLARLHEPLEMNLGPFRQVEFRPGVILLPLPTATLPPAAYTNCYLLGTPSCVLIDPGSPGRREIDWLIAAVEAAESQLGRKLIEIWLTHHHPDHVGGAAELSQRLGVPVAAHAETARRLAGQVRIDREIADGEITALGSAEHKFTVRAVHTPGHARGHLGFFHEELGSLVVGDVVAGFGTIVIDPPEGDMQQYLDTLDALLELAPRTLFPGHGPTILDALGKLRDYRQHRRWREERIFRAWCRGARAPEEMLAEVYDDVPERALPLAARQIEAHLQRLEALGRLGRLGESLPGADLS